MAEEKLCNKIDLNCPDYCDHKEPHLDKNPCGKICTAEAVIFAKENKNCVGCIYSDNCDQWIRRKNNEICNNPKEKKTEKRKYTLSPLRPIDLLKNGEDCKEYRNRKKFTECKCVS